MLPKLEWLGVWTPPFHPTRSYAGRWTLAFVPLRKYLRSGSLSRGSTGLSVRCRSRLAQVGGRLLQHLLGQVVRVNRMRLQDGKFPLKFGLDLLPRCEWAALHEITNAARAT